MRVILPDETIKFFEEQEREEGVDIEARRKENEEFIAELKKEGKEMSDEELLMRKNMIYDEEANGPLSIEDLPHYCVSQ